MAVNPVVWSRLALVVVAGALAARCASSGAVPRPFPVPGGAEPAGVSIPEASAPPGPAPAPPVPPPGAAAAAGYMLTSTALALRGAPYLNGGATPAGFDCSGFVQYVFGRHGLAIPRETREQFRLGRSVDRAAVSPGDLVFFTTIAPGASHVGIAIDGDQFVHAPSSRGVVRVERLSSEYWSRRFIGARRY